MCALGDATLLATTSMATLVSGAFWFFDISNLHEFGYRMRKFLGGDENEKKIAELPVDKETKDLEKKLTDMVNGKD